MGIKDTNITRIIFEFLKRGSQTVPFGVNELDSWNVV